ncbi:MAG: hypothetical protein EA365_00205 [Gloeocapsa sp. DLM2.Bin57]|nr:MAG: hypothetical protein EA365_00205 [Gloeocapsa sp. DLM2.Bin57]
MVIFVITINLIITLFNFYLAWKIWRFYLFLSKFNASLSTLEQPLQSFLKTAPIWLNTSYTYTHSLHSKYQKIAKICNLTTQLWFLSRRFIL